MPLLPVGRVSPRNQFPHAYMAESPCVTVERRDRVAVLTIAHPPANALNAQVLTELDEHVSAAQADPQVKVIVITGAGDRFFVAGADITELAEIEHAAQGQQLAARGQEIFTRIENGDTPVIAAINGLALGGGCELAMACHLRLASESAKFGQPEIKLGIIPGYGGTQRLPRLIGATRAAEWILTGRMVDAAEALAAGLVNRVLPAGDLEPAALELATTLAGLGGRAIAAALHAIRTAGGGTLAYGLEREAELFGATCATDDFREGVSAFLEKRPPTFTDQ